jgi:hypothetical protein
MNEGEEKSAREQKIPQKNMCQGVIGYTTN